MTGPGRLPVRPAPDGTVIVGPTPAAPAGTVLVPLDGATAVVDPTGRGPQVIVHDPERAAGTVAALFGDDVAAAVATGTNADVEPIDTDECVQLERLGWLEWLSDNRPVPLDPHLLWLETAVARAELPLRALGGEIGSDVGEDLKGDEEVIATVSAVAHALREHPTLPLRGPLLALTRIAMANLPVGNDATHPDLAHERELLRVMDAWGTAALDVGDLAWLDAAVLPAQATHLGPSPARGLSSLDWRRVPRDLLPAPEASVAFQLSDRPDGSAVLSVTVAGPQRATPHPAFPHRGDAPSGVIASLTAERWPLPLATGPITFDPERDLWHGVFPVKPMARSLARQAPGLDVDVRASHLPFTPPDPAARRRSLARRWTARAVASSRLADAAGDPRRGDAAREAFAYSARLWAEAGDADAAERCRALATEPLAPVDPTLAERWLLESGPQR